MPPIRVECYTGKLPRAPNFADTGAQFGGDLPRLIARKDLSEEFKRKMLYDNPVRFYRFGEDDIAAARKAKGN
jgi:hypothetical protein